MQSNSSAVLKFVITLAFLPAAAVAQEPAIVRSRVASPIDINGFKLAKIYSSDFSRDQKIVFENDLIGTKGGKSIRTSVPDAKAEWIVEGNGGDDIRNGELRASPFPLDANGKQLLDQPRSHLVIWNRNVFPADLLIEFDMRPNGSTSGLTILFFSAAGKDGGDIFDMKLPPRLADYKAYHSGEIANYSDSYWSRNTEVESITNRLRKNPGFLLVAEGESLTTGPTDVTHHVRVFKFGGHIEIEINGKVVSKWNDPGKPLGAGRIGFRSMDGVKMITYDNLNVWRLTKS